jgi:hypothetical protein
MGVTSAGDGVWRCRKRARLLQGGWQAAAACCGVWWLLRGG